MGGVDTLDTAIAYGESETCLGKAGVKEFKIVTKLPALPEEIKDINGWVHNQIESSLGRLGVDSLYAVLLHRPEQLLGVTGEHLYAALQALKADGLTRKVGVSIYTPIELGMLFPRFGIDIVQAPFNLVDRRLQTSGWLARLKAADVEIHVRSVFLQGLLLMSRCEIPAKFARWTPLWDSWHRWLSNPCAPTAVQACLSFSLAFPEVDRVVVGSDNAEQLDEIMRAVVTPSQATLPDLLCDDEDLLNPARWSQL